MTLTQRNLLLYLRDLGWSEVEVGPRRLSAQEKPAALHRAVAVRGIDDTLEGLAQRLADCRRCRLCEGRTQVVFGVGNPRARLMFIGEGPGQEEDRLGEPFVGRAGRLLDRQRRQVPASRHPRSAGRRGGGVPAVFGTAGGAGRAGDHRDVGADRRLPPAGTHGIDAGSARPLDELARPPRLAHLPPGVSAAHPVGQGGRLAGPQGSAPRPGGWLIPAASDGCPRVV